MLYKIKELLFGKKETIDISKKPIPCIECGACCAYFKVGFKRANNQQVPWQTIKIVRGESFMEGAEIFKGRCNQLTGDIGKHCLCSIYENRPDVCDLFSVWLPNGKQNPRCIKAREFHGLVGKIEE